MPDSRSVVKPYIKAVFLTDEKEECDFGESYLVSLVWFFFPSSTQRQMFSLLISKTTIIFITLIANGGIDHEALVRDSLSH